MIVLSISQHLVSFILFVALFDLYIHLGKIQELNFYDNKYLQQWFFQLQTFSCTRMKACLQYQLKLQVIKKVFFIKTVIFFVTGEMKFNVEVKGKVTTEFYHHEDRGSHIYEKCCRFIVNGRPAYGITEFHNRCV